MMHHPVHPVRLHRSKLGPSDVGGYLHLGPNPDAYPTCSVPKQKSKNAVVATKRNTRLQRVSVTSAPTVATIRR